MFKLLENVSFHLSSSSKVKKREICILFWSSRRKWCFCYLLFYWFPHFVNYLAHFDYFFVNTQFGTSNFQDVNEKNMSHLSSKSQKSWGKIKSGGQKTNKWSGQAPLTNQVDHGVQYSRPVSQVLMHSFMKWSLTENIFLTLQHSVILSCSLSTKSQWNPNFKGLVQQRAIWILGHFEKLESKFKILLIFLPCLHFDIWVEDFFVKGNWLLFIFSGLNNI